MRGMTACQRCRRRKQKCDQKHPNCSNCEKAHVPCLTYHSGKQADIPRNYMSNLEAQVEKLSQEIQELRTRIQASSVNGDNATSLETCSPARHEPGAFPTEKPASDRSSSHFQDLVKSVENVVDEPSRQPRFLGQSDGITLARLVMAAINVDALPSPLFSEQRSHDPSLSALAAEASLPPRHVADHLVEVYFQYRTPHLPIVERSQVDEALESAYLTMSGHQPSNRVVERDIFTAYMIFAIALCDVPNPSGGRPIQSEGCFRSAIGWVEKIITYSKSLHWETEEQSIDMDPDLLHDRRRLWYSTYQFERVLCITLGRPFGIIDESTRVQLPNPWAVSHRSLDREPNEFDIHSQRAHNHLLRMAKLESEIKHVQHSQTWSLNLAYPRTNYSAWVQDIQPRLQEWYATIPQPSKAHPSSIFASQAYWDTIYNNSILLLYRPNYSTTLHPSTEVLFISFEASCKLISSIKILQREGRIDMLWKSVHHLFMAGLGVIYGLWHSKEIRDRNPVQNSISTLQSCASTLSALSESFTGAAGCRDCFETLSSATVDWLVTNDAEKIRQNRLEFEKQVNDLLHQLQPSRGGMVTTNESSANNMSTMLSTDSFALSEMLSSAAQWPDFQDMNFGDIGPKPMTGAGINSGSYIF